MRKQKKKFRINLIREYLNLHKEATNCEDPERMQHLTLELTIQWHNFNVEERNYVQESFEDQYYNGNEGF